MPNKAFRLLPFFLLLPAVFVFQFAAAQPEQMMKISPETQRNTFFEELPFELDTHLLRSLKFRRIKVTHSGPHKDVSHGEPIMNKDTIVYAFNGSGRLTGVTSENSHGKDKTTLLYDAKGRCTGNDWYYGQMKINVDTRIQYDAKGRPLKEVSTEQGHNASDGIVIAYFYTGSLLTKMIYCGTPYTYEYDSLNRLTKSWKEPAGKERQLQASYSYDDKGRLSKIDEKDYRVTELTYDASGLLVCAKATYSYYASHATMRFHYNPDKTLQQVTYDECSLTISLEYFK